MDQTNFCAVGWIHLKFYWLIVLKSLFPCELTFNPLETWPLIID